MYLRLSLVLTLLLFTCFSCTTEEVNDITLEEALEVNPTSQEIELFVMINTYRASKNLNTLSFDSDAYIAASSHTEYMIKTGDKGHTNFDKRASKISAKKPVKFIAENVANDYLTIEEAFKAWLNSSDHKKNLEGNYTHSAMSIKKGKKDKLYFTQIFFR